MLWVRNLKKRIIKCWWIGDSQGYSTYLIGRDSSIGALILSCGGYGAFPLIESGTWARYRLIVKTKLGHVVNSFGNCVGNIIFIPITFLMIRKCVTGNYTNELNNLLLFLAVHYYKAVVKNLVVWNVQKPHLSYISLSLNKAHILFLYGHRC